ncbi:MAG: hypothetical protein AAF491_09380 [Verrucomicrobiota bacterium]
MASSIVAFPSPKSGWVLMDGAEPVDQGAELSSLAKKRNDLLIGFPSTKVSTFAVSLPVTDSSLHESMIYAQIEKRGLAGASLASTLFDFQSIEKLESSETFAVSVVSELDDEWVVLSAEGYAPAAGLQTSPEGGARLWAEHKRLILGIFDEGRPVHVQALSGSGTVDASAAQEVSLLLLSLAGDEALADRMPTGLEVAVPDVSEEARAEFASRLSLPVHSFSESVESREDCEGVTRLLPAEVARFRRNRAAKQKAIAVGSVLLVAYLVMGAWLWMKGKRAVREIESIEQQIAIVEPDATRIQKIDLRWSELEPAFEKSWFPLVQLNSFTSALPGSGVVVREFRTTGRNLRIRGQARDVQLANRLLEDLQTMEAFAAYEWNMPNPKVEKNNTATFEIEGKPRNADADS